MSKEKPPSTTNAGKQASSTGWPCKTVCAAKFPGVEHFKSFARRKSRKVNRYALDTSVLLRWFSQIHDADSDRALALRQEQLSEKVKLTVLELSVYKLAHVLKDGQTI